MIVDVEATSAHRTKEVNATQTMIDRVERRFALKPTRLEPKQPQTKSTTKRNHRFPMLMAVEIRVFLAIEAFR